MQDLLSPDLANWLIQASYFLAAILFIWGLKQMSHPRTARGGVILAGIGIFLIVDAGFYFVSGEGLY